MMADESSRRSSRDASDRPKTNVTREAQSSNFDVVQAMVQEREKRSIVPGRFKEAAKEALRGIGEDMTYMLYKPILTRSERRNRAAEDELERKTKDAERRKDEAQAPIIEEMRQYEQEQREKHVSLGEKTLALRQEWLEKRSLYLKQNINEDEFMNFQRKYVENVKGLRGQILDNEKEYHEKIEPLKVKEKEAKELYDREERAASEEFFAATKGLDKYLDMLQTRREKVQSRKASEPSAERSHREVGTAEGIEEIQETSAWKSENVQHALKLLYREDPGSRGWRERAAGVLSEYQEAVQELSEGMEKYSGAQEEMHRQNRGKGKAVAVEGDRQSQDKDKKEDVRDIVKDLDAIYLALKDGGALYQAGRQERQKFDAAIGTTWSEISDIVYGRDPFRDQ